MSRCLVLIALSFALSSCAYKMGYGYQELPRGLKSLYVPMFQNDSQDVGPEVDFTSHLVQELKRSKVAKLLSKDQADGLLEGRIIRITRLQKTHEVKAPGVVKERGLVNLPDGSFVATEYLLKVKIELRLRDRKTQNIIWKQWFEDQALYSSARLALAGINTSVANYTASEDQRVMKQLAGVMMEEAVGRLTENF